VRRRHRGENRVQAAPETVEAVNALVLVCSDTMIAGLLNRNGLRTGRGNRWTRERVTSLRSKRKISVYSAERRQAEGWMTLNAAAAHVGLSPKTLRLAVERGEVNALHPLPDGPWIFKRESLESSAVRNRVHSKGGGRRNPAGLIAAESSLFPSST